MNGKGAARGAFVVDDVLLPRQAGRCGAEVFEEGGREVHAEMIRIHPEIIVGWGLETDAIRPNSRSVG